MRAETEDLGEVVSDVLKANASLPLVRLAPIAPRLWKKVAKAISSSISSFADDTDVLAVLQLECNNWIVLKRKTMIFCAHLPFCGSNMIILSYGDFASVRLAFGGQAKMGSGNIHCDSRDMISYDGRALFNPTMAPTPADKIVALMRQIRDAIRSHLLNEGFSLAPINDEEAPDEH